MLGGIFFIRIYPAVFNRVKRGMDNRNRGISLAGTHIYILTFYGRQELDTDWPNTFGGGTYLDR